VSSVWLLLATSLTVVLAFAGVIWMRVRAQHELGAGEWQDALNFSIDKYRPMERLLCRDDEHFLRSQPGFHPSMLKTLRRDRRRVFRCYLGAIRRDFNGLYLAARQSVLLSDLEYSGLLQSVIKQRLVFYWAFGMVEWRLALYTLGVGTVDVQPVLDLLNAMRESAIALRPLPNAA
jgi:hypothetical protein